MNLWDLGLNNTAKISALPEATESKLTENLVNLGIRRNALIKCLHKTFFGGPRVYEINGTVCTLCKAGAEQILIQP